MTFIGGVGATVSLPNMPIVGPWMQRMADGGLKTWSEKAKGFEPEETARELRDTLEIFHKEGMYDVHHRPSDHARTMPGLFMAGAAAGLTVSLPAVLLEPSLKELPIVAKTAVTIGVTLLSGVSVSLLPALAIAAQAQGNIRALIEGAAQDFNTGADRFRALAALGYYGASQTRDVEIDALFNRRLLKQSKLETALFDFLLKATSKTPEHQIDNALDLLANHFESAYTLYHLYCMLLHDPKADSNLQPQPIAEHYKKVGNQLRQKVALSIFKVFRAKPHKYYDFVNRQMEDLSPSNTTFDHDRNVIYSMAQEFNEEDRIAFYNFCETCVFMANNKDGHGWFEGCKEFVGHARKTGSDKEKMAFCLERLKVFEAMSAEELLLLPKNELLNWMYLLASFGEEGKQAFFDFLQTHCTDESDPEGASGFFKKAYVSFMLDEKHDLRGFHFKGHLVGNKADSLIRAGASIDQVLITDLCMAVGLREQDIQAYVNLLNVTDNLKTRVYAAHRLGKLKSHPIAREALERFVDKVESEDDVDASVRMAYKGLIDDMHPDSLSSLVNLLGFTEALDHMVVGDIAKKAQDDWDLYPLHSALEHHALGKRFPTDHFKSNPLKALVYADFASSKQYQAMMDVFVSSIEGYPLIGKALYLTQRRLDAAGIIMKAWYDTMSKTERFVVINDVIMRVMNTLVLRYQEPELRVAGDDAVFETMLTIICTSGVRVTWKDNSAFSDLMKTIISEERIPIYLRILPVRLVQAFPNSTFIRGLTTISGVEAERLKMFGDVHPKSPTAKMLADHRSFLDEVNIALERCKNI